VGLFTPRAWQVLQSFNSNYQRTAQHDKIGAALFSSSARWRSQTPLSTPGGSAVRRTAPVQKQNSASTTSQNYLRSGKLSAFMNCLAIVSSIDPAVWGRGCPASLVESFPPKVRGRIRRFPVGACNVTASTSNGLHFNFDVDARREVQVRERVDRLSSRLNDIQQPFVDAHFILVTAVLVHER